MERYFAGEERGRYEVGYEEDNTAHVKQNKLGQQLQLRWETENISGGTVD